jgi:hypothetical protein
MVLCSESVCDQRTLTNRKGYRVLHSALETMFPLNFSLLREFALVNVACAQGQGLSKFKLIHIHLNSQT